MLLIVRESEKGNAMNEMFEDSSYSDLKREVQALRKRIEDLESGEARPKAGGRATWWRRLSKRPAWTLPLVIVAVLLALGVLGAQSSKQDALFIDSNGNVGINQSKPQSPLDVNGNALFRGSLGFPDQPGDKISLSGQTGSAHYGFGIQSSLLQIHTRASADDIAFGYGKSDSLTETMRIKGNGSLVVGDRLFVQGRPGDTASITKNAFINATGKWEVKDTSKKAFTIELRESMLELYGTVTNGKTDWRKMATFNAANNQIDFPGPEVRGKLWTSQEFEWKQNPWAGTDSGSWKQMTKADHSACFLTFVSGSFQGNGEAVGIKEEGGYWKLGGYSQQKHLWAKARCIGAPDNSW
jgi:hypothetical protein